MTTGMLLSCISWIVVFAAFTGIGAFVLRVLGRRLDGTESILDAFWFGFALTIGTLQIGQLMWPVGPSTLAGVLGTGAIGLLVERGPLRLALGRGRDRIVRSPAKSALFIGLAVLLLLWLANRAMGPVTPPGDSGFYHIGAVRWLQFDHLLPGLGNVDSRFGFNNSFFLYMALLDGPSGPPHFFHVGMPVLLLAVLAECAFHLWKLRVDGAAARGRNLLGALWTASLVGYAFMEASSTSSDTAMLFIGMVVGIRLCRLVYERRPHRDALSDAMLVVALATIGVTIKLSFAFLGFFAVVSALVCLAREPADAPGAPRWRSLRRVAPALAVAVVIAVSVIGTWLVRGVLISGYLAYPVSPSLSVDVDWQVADWQVVVEKRIIEVWARYPFEDGLTDEEVLGSHRWVGRWFMKTVQRADVFSIPMGLFIVGLGFYWRGARHGRIDHGKTLLLIGPPVVAMVFWFVTAPAERFGGAVFWLAGAGLWAVLYEASPSPATRLRHTRGALGFVAVTVSIAIVVGAALSHARYGWSVIVPPGSEAGFHPLPKPLLETHQTAGGLAYYVPVGVSPGSSSRWVPGVRCWDAPLPCTSRVMDELVERESGTMQRGFRLADHD